MPPPTTGGTLMKEVMTTQSVIPLGVENKPLNGDVTKEVGQVVKDAQPTLSSAPLAV